MSHVPFGSGTADAEEGTEIMAGLESLLEIVSGIEIKMCVTTFQVAAQTNDVQARVEMFILDIAQLKARS